MDINKQNKIYKIINKKQDYIETKIINSLKQLKIEPIPNYSFPYIHILPKFHKTPIGFRVIIASSTAITKSTSSMLTKILKLLQNKAECNAKYKTKFNGYNPFWIISNNKPILNCIKSINKQKKANNITTFDFTTLYTTLDLNLIRDAFKHLCEELFKYKKKDSLIKVSKYKAYWYTGEPDSTSMDKEYVINCIDWLISNTYFKFGNLLLKQEIGIPMGTDCAPFLANLFLYYFEEKFIKNCIQNKEFEKCKKLKSVFRYIDDLTVLNDDGFFLTNFNKIYPPCLDLKLINTTSNQCADVLDIHIEIKNKNFYTSLFDKRKNFPFKCMQFPHKSSCLSLSLFRNIVMCETVRYDSICYTNQNLSNNISCLTQILTSRGYSIEEIFFAYRKCFFKTTTLYNRFDRKVNNFINSI